MSATYDVIVIGAGAAGLTAARHAAAAGASVLLLEQMGAGGQVSTVEGITNFPGQPEPTAGYDLGVQLLEEAESAGAEVMLAHVETLIPSEDEHVVVAGGDEFRARAVVVAVGSRRLELGVAGEAELTGRGVSHCASCDGPFFTGKEVILVGGGDSAFDEARILADHARAVTIVHTGSAPTARDEVIDRALQHDNIEVRPGATVSAVHGQESVEGVTIRDTATQAESVVPAQGVFVYVGLEPNTDWLEGVLDRDELGRLVVDDALATSRAGVFAAGDVRSGTAAMLWEAVADGERAARSALARVAAAAGDAVPTTAGKASA